MFHVEQFLQQQLSGAGFAFSNFQFQQFRDYSNEILKWNRKVRITGAKTEKDILDHILISLSFQDYLDGSPRSRVLDLGSGVGFPGIPLKISRPELKMDLVDSRSKRISFLKNVVRKLDLQEVNCYLARCEDLRTEVHPDLQYDFIVSRAVGSLKEIVRSSTHLLPINGKWIILKGKKAVPEVDQVLKSYQGKIEIKTFHLSEKEWERDLLFVVMVKCST